MPQEDVGVGLAGTDDVLGVAIGAGVRRRRGDDHYGRRRGLGRLGGQGRRGQDGRGGFGGLVGAAIIAAVIARHEGHAEHLAHPEVILVNAGVALGQLVNGDAEVCGDGCKGFARADGICHAADTGVRLAGQTDLRTDGDGGEVHIRVGQLHGLDGGARLMGDGLQRVAHLPGVVARAPGADAALILHGIDLLMSLGLPQKNCFFAALR